MVRFIVFRRTLSLANRLVAVLNLKTTITIDSNINGSQMTEQEINNSRPLNSLFHSVAIVRDEARHPPTVQLQSQP